MAESLFSPHWYRFAESTPRLLAGVTVRHQHYRDEAWYVLLSTTTSRQYRINRRAYQFIGRCDGHLTVEHIWDDLLETMQDEAPTQEEIIGLLTRLAEEGLVDYGATPNFSGQRGRLRKRRHRGFPNPLAFRVPLGDPSRLLDRLEVVAKWMFHPAALWLWIAVVGLATISAAAHWDALRLHAETWMGTPRHLFLAWLAYPFIKALHELGHALAVRHWGGAVHDTGVGLFMLTPAPYVDASASAGFRRRHQRATVAAMGVAVELALAAFALFVWLEVQPGLVRDLAFVTMMIASVSTLAFNGNPLMTFDAYHVLCDALDLPNLAARSRRWWQLQLQRAVFGAERVAPMHVTDGERGWLLAYAPLSWSWRVVVAAAIVLWVGHWSVILGLLVGAYSLVTVVALPMIGAARGLVRAAPDASRRSRAGRMVGAIGLAIVVACCAVPLPFRTSAWGIVQLPDQSHARPGTDGFITAFAARDGDRVTPGQLLLTLHDPALTTERDRLQSRLVGLQANRFDAMLGDNRETGNLQEELLRVRGELAQVESRIAQLEVRSHTAGVFVMPHQDDLLGTWTQRGATLGYVLDGRTAGVRAAVPESDAALIREGHRSIEVRLAESAGDTVEARLVRDVPAATNELPSPALGDRGGGPHVTDPSDEHGVRTTEPVVVIDLALPPDRVPERVGGRVRVRFDHGMEPIAVQAYRRLRQLFLQHFSPTGS